jgi:hypothetical protein
VLDTGGIKARSTQTRTEEFATEIEQTLSAFRPPAGSFDRTSAFLFCWIQFEISKIEA